MGSKRARWALVVVAVAALVVVATAAARTQSTASKTVVIGWAYDGSSGGPMNPFDAPALAAAQIEVTKINAHGGVNGMKLVIKTCNTQGDNPTVSTTCANKLISEDHANVIFTTCDVDLAAPVVQAAINKRVAHGRAVHRHRPDGPEAVRGEGQARLQLRQRRSGRGLRDGAARVEQGLEDRRSREGHDDRVLQGRRHRVQGAVHCSSAGRSTTRRPTRIPRSAGPCHRSTTRQPGIAAHPSAVVVTSTAGAYGALAPFITDLRTSGDNAAVLNSWAGDGNYWLPSSPKINNYWFVTYANAFGHDPNKAVNTLASQIHAATGGFVAGPAAIDGLVTAIKRADGLPRRLEARRADGEVPQRPDALGPRELLRDAPHVLRPRVSRDRDQQQHADREGD